MAGEMKTVIFRYLNAQKTAIEQSEKKLQSVTIKEAGNDAHRQSHRSIRG